MNNFPGNILLFNGQTIWKNDLDLDMSWACPEQKLFMCFKDLQKKPRLSRENVYRQMHLPPFDHLYKIVFMCSHSTWLTSPFV